MRWIREAISDSDGVADMAYVCIGILAAAAIGSLAFIMVMATISYVRCTHIVDVGEGQRAAVACVFDPLPIGQSAGLIFGAFGALIGALAGYMAATRRAAATKHESSTTTATATIVTKTPADDAPPRGPKEMG